MTQFKLFDNVKLIKNVSLSDGRSVPQETSGTIVEIFNNGEAYLVEFFGGWVKYSPDGNFVPANKNDQDSFMETVGVETVYEHQITLTASAREVMEAKEHLNAILETFPEDLVLQVRDFAEFLQPSFYNTEKILQNILNRLLSPFSQNLTEEHK